MKTLRLAWCLIGTLATFDHGWAQAPDLRKPDNRPSQAIAQPEPKFRREVVDANTAPWSSIGKVGNSIGGHCTGTVIGSNRFVTAAHCLYNKAAHRFISAGSIHLLLGYVREQYRVHTVAVNYTVPPGFDPAATAGSFAEDWAVLNVSDPFPSDIKPLPMAEGLPPRGAAASVAGYARERLYMMTADQHCQVLATSSDGKLIAHDCVLEPGDSGGPLLGSGAAGETVLLGVNVASPRGKDAKGGLGVSAASIEKFLAAAGTPESPGQTGR
jgi:protease YdgD